MSSNSWWDTLPITWKVNLIHQELYTFSWCIHSAERSEFSVSLESSFICKRWIERATAKLRLKEENQYCFIFLFVELGEECLQIIIMWYCEEIEIVVIIFQKDRLILGHWAKVQISFRLRALFLRPVKGEWNEALFSFLGSFTMYLAYDKEKK